MSKAPTLYEAVGNFLGPLMAEYALFVEDCDPDMQVVVNFAGYEHETSMRAIKDLNDAYRSAFDAKQARLERKGDGPLFNTRGISQ